MMSYRDILKELRIVSGLLALVVLLNACARPECQNTNPV